MDPDSIETWLEGRQRQAHGPLRPHTAALYALLKFSKTPQEVSRDLVDDVSSQPPDPDSDRAWRLWQLVFSAAIEWPRCHDDLVQLICSIYTTEPVHPEEGPANRLMWDLWTCWRDDFDALGTHYHSGKRLERDPSTPASRARINFTAFSAKLLDRGGKVFADGIGAFAFFDIRDLLEQPREGFLKDALYVEGQKTPSQLRSTELEAALQWILYAGDAVRSLDDSAFDGFEEGMRQPTPFWRGAPGMSDERWHFWRRRLEHMLENEDLGEGALETGRQAIAAFRER